ncbi:unnamed protein product [Fusarium equiseti]|uniref:2EXR domain-containing protein n=1 Tax=Fusarium equiseti TaxID=61235 RepID=A0A8J2NP38_FUSEQ|nr:unnamed protein product [Fusarium equiseti]
MSSPTVHPFPKLPYELRLLIWEASCFNGNKNTRHGLNYIDVSGSLKCRPAEKSKTSVCLMDTGLPKVEGPAHIRTRIIISGRDLFCFRISDWYNRRMWAPAFDFYLDRCKGISQAKVCNLAFELDVVDWGENSMVIGPVIRKALRQARLQARGSWGENLRLSIIDKDVHWYRDDSTVNVTYADSDDEYTIVSWEILCYCDQTALGTGAHALRKYIRPSYEDSTEFYRWMEETVKVLVRRDNESSFLFLVPLPTSRNFYKELYPFSIPSLKLSFCILNHPDQMSAPTFHRFPDLPCELRHDIWEASCFNRHDTRHGMHYVHCTGLSYHLDTAIKCRPANESETSACLMDAGLWGACHESRRVMEKRMKRQGLMLTDASAKNSSLCLEGPEPALLLLSSRQDLVCFKISDWWRKQMFTPMFFFYLVCVEAKNEDLVFNVGFEMDGNWDFQNRIWQSITQALRYGSFGLDECHKINMSIIDKDVHWHRDDDFPDVTYADCNNEYTVVQWKSLCPSAQRGLGSGTRAFLTYMRRGYDQTSSSGAPPCLEVEGWVNILVRRDNEVEPCQLCQKPNGKKLYDSPYGIAQFDGRLLNSNHSMCLSGVGAQDVES